MYVISFSQHINLFWQIGNKLKVLDLSGCEKLRRIPGISNYWMLERLILEDCCSLVEIGHSIGRLHHLKYLNVSGCSSLQSFPVELGDLSSLEEIIMEQQPAFYTTNVHW